MTNVRKFVDEWIKFDFKGRIRRAVYEWIGD